MILNHWITKDYFDQIVNVNFVEPDIEYFNWLLHVTDKKTLRYLMTAEMHNGSIFQTEHYKLVFHAGNTLELIFPARSNISEYLPTDFFQKVIEEYLEELQKMEDYLNGCSF